MTEVEHTHDGSHDSESDDVVSRKTVLAYIEKVCQVLMDLPGSDELRLGNYMDEYEKRIDQFISEPNVRVLQVQISNQVNNQNHLAVQLHLEMNLLTSDEENEPEQQGQTIVFIKRQHRALVTSSSLQHQLHTITLSNETSTKTLNVLYTYIQQSFSPFLNAYGHHLEEQEARGGSSSSRKFPVLQKKMKELELAMLHYQQNLDIPRINLVIHPEIEQARGNADSLTERLTDDAFVNELQAGVNRWIKEIQKLTRLTRDPRSGTALEEINFWSHLHQALLHCEALLDRPEIDLTLRLLRQAKRYLVTVTFESDHGLTSALKRVSQVMTLMKEFPITGLLSATVCMNI